jgi:hypothetical protein
VFSPVMHHKLGKKNYRGVALGIEVAKRDGAEFAWQKKGPS